MSSCPQPNIEYFWCSYSGRKKDCEAALDESPVADGAFGPNSVLRDMWSIFGCSSEEEVRRTRGEKSAREVDSTVKDGVGLPPNSLPALFPYPFMQLSHLASIHLVVSAYVTPAPSEAPGSIPHQRQFVGAAAVVFCSIGGSQNEAYLQLLWVDPSYRRLPPQSPPLSATTSPGPRLSIGTTLLDLIIAKSFADHKCLRFRLHTMVYRPLPASLAAKGSNATREAELAKYFSTKPGGLATDAGTMTDIVGKLYSSFGLVERKYIQGYYDCGDNAATPVSVGGAMASLRPDAIEMQVDYKAFQSASKARGRSLCSTPLTSLGN